MTEESSFITASGFIITLSFYFSGRVCIFVAITQQEGAAAATGLDDDTKMAAGSHQLTAASVKHESSGVNGFDSSTAYTSQHAAEVARQSKEKRSAFVMFCSLQRKHVQDIYLEVGMAAHS